MKLKKRHEFSRLGFIMAAAGSAVGLGNILTFPSQVANHGGAAFVLVYILLTIFIVYPALIAEVTIGRYSRSNLVDVFKTIPKARKWSFLGFFGLVSISLMLAWYGILGGWIVNYFIKSSASITSWKLLENNMQSNSMTIKVIGTTIFFIMTTFIITAGLKKGIEAWSKFLMPLLLALLLGLIIYVATLEGAFRGWAVYLIPDFAKCADIQLWVSALGQAFFSASLGVGVMLIYGSYLSKEQSIMRVGAWVLIFDFTVAFLAGLLIIPALYAAEAGGQEIFDGQGKLIGGLEILFDTLTSLFGGLGITGHFMLATFFLLLIIAALTSSISMLEVPVSYIVDREYMSRKKASWLVGILCWCISLGLLFNYELLFGWVVKFTTSYMQPGVSIIYCILAGWLLQRNQLAQELEQGSGGSKEAYLLKILPFFFKYIVPSAVTIILISQLV